MVLDLMRRIQMMVMRARRDQAWSVVLKAQIGGKCKADAVEEKKPADGKKMAAWSSKSIAAAQPATKKPRTGIEKINAVLASV